MHFAQILAIPTILIIFCTCELFILIYSTDFTNYVAISKKATYNLKPVHGQINASLGLLPSCIVSIWLLKNPNKS